MEDSTLIASWAGLYTITPDWSMIATGSRCGWPVPGRGRQRALLQARSGDRGVPGRADRHGRADTVDITPLRASRFADGATLRSTYGGIEGDPSDMSSPHLLYK